MPNQKAEKEFPEEFSNRRLFAGSGDEVDLWDFDLIKTLCKKKREGERGDALVVL